MQRPQAIDKEYCYNEGRAIISETDLRGKITFANRKFCEIAGYSTNELIGQPHNIIRHPDMPKVAFMQMWKTIQANQSWHGLVKNLRKDGLYYWVDTFISPKYDTNGNINGYIAARKPASKKDIQQIISIYKRMKKDEN